MSEVTFEKMVQILSKPGEEILQVLTADDCHALHMLMGIAGEWAEVVAFESIQNLIEELGDIEFYNEGLRQCFGIHYSEVSDFSPSLEYEPGIVCIGEIVDIVKKNVIYRKPLDRKALVCAMRKFEISLYQLRENYNIDRNTVLSKNMEKLLTGEKARYKLGLYTDEQAQTRQDKV